MLHRRTTLLLLLTLTAGAGAQPNMPYRDARLSAAVRAQDLLGRMTLEEKFWQLFMLPGSLDDSTHDYSRGVFGLQVSAFAERAPSHAPALHETDRAAAARSHAERINAIQRYLVERTRLGIPMIPFDEAAHGLMRDGATVYPAAIALAATWDSSLVRRVAEATAIETRSRGVRQVLSPVVNIASDVRWGRVEETYGEDPYLSSVMARAFVGALEQGGIIATPKHFVANVGDGGRDSYPIDFDARLLEEVFFPPFRAAITQARARSVMTAYNSVDGSPATQSGALLNGTLKHDWGFTGFVISDAAATAGATVLHDTEASAATAAKNALDAGLDVIFQSSWEQHRPYLRALQSGTIAMPVIDSAVARVLRAKFELGLFEHPYVNTDSATLWAGHERHRALAREAARASVVLLRNEKTTLPLSRSLQSIAVIGTDAAEARLGGYTARNAHGVSMLDGIRARLSSGTTVRYAPGPGRLSADHVAIPAGQLLHVDSGRVVPGLVGEYFGNTRLAGTPSVVRVDPHVDFTWTLSAPARGLSRDWYSVRWSGRVVVPAGGVRRVGVEGNDGYRLYVDNKLVIDNWRKQSYRTTLTAVRLAASSTHDIRLEFFESTGNVHLKLVWDAGIPDDSAWRRQIDSAVAVARRSDVAIVAAGIEEGEFRDRAMLSLPGHQAELIERVAATGTPTVVVLVGGSAITMSQWIDRVGAVIDAWYPGEEGGRAIADVLFGEANPAGRLPITFPIAEGQLPLVYNHKPTGRGDDYVDLTGQPLFPFGFGLSYTSFAYDSLAIEPAEIAPDGRATVRCRIANVGARAGDEVVQLYIRDVLASVARPVQELKGFARVHLEPGESRAVTFSLSRDELRMLDRDMRWVVEPGAFRVMVGASSKDIRLRGELVVRE